jgi:hypothetical protein
MLKSADVYRITNHGIRLPAYPLSIAHVCRAASELGNTTTD